MYGGDVSLVDAQAILGGLVGQLNVGTEVVVEDNVCEIPRMVHLVVRHENGPLGDYVLKWELTWGESGVGSAQRPITALIPA